MNQRTLFIFILAVIFLIIAYHSWKKVSITKTSNEQRTSINIEIKKEPVENKN
jgi:hypothetical protein